MGNKAKSKADKQAALKAEPAVAALTAVAPAAATPAPVKEIKGPGKIEQIIALHKDGKTNPEIVAAGFNKTTVSIQVSAYKKDPKGWEAKHKY